MGCCSVHAVIQSSATTAFHKVNVKHRFVLLCVFYVVSRFSSVDVKRLRVSCFDYTSPALCVDAYSRKSVEMITSW